ncbi:MAG TPA: D-glycero-beta-D-manno-heptose 1-phosphate adenylyltransferase [Elusimicrobia bacterium]|jgi:D-beta-D-heptose 7-phosphate kinase/D-beta-D-heptose 1-phosphate adenosyltransferase|nr:D-glycero-beta-D-manno-heptose 1-phosphate adenylyltransferase [Elusimicrobiota bacterium]
MNTSGKLKTLKSALAWRRAQSRAGRKVVFTNGCFDILHAGHVTLLERSRSLGDALVLGLNSDASVRRLKGPTRPVNKLADRARVLCALACVDAVVPFGEDTPVETLKALRPDILVKGADYGHSEIKGREYAGRTVRVPLLKGRSTTGLIKRLK